MMGKTVKQLAEELGVSKTAIRKYMTLDFRKKYVETTANGVLIINEEGANQLQKLRKLPQTPQTKFAGTTENQGLQEKETVAILKGQLDIKDEQIKAMSDQLAALQAELGRERQHARDLSDRLVVLTDQAQQLHAGTIQERLTVQEQGEQVVVSEQSAQGSDNAAPVSKGEAVVEQSEKKKSWREWLGDWIAERK
jgi:DNA-binding transcriptional regulator YhcF (GntR family)